MKQYRLAVLVAHHTRTTSELLLLAVASARSTAALDSICNQAAQAFSPSLQSVLSILNHQIILGHGLRCTRTNGEAIDGAL